MVKTSPTQSTLVSMPDDIEVTSKLITRLASLLIKANHQCTVAESCTGGLISATMTSYPGSSQWFDSGLVTYSNAAKHRFLGVPSDILDTYGAVSQETVIAMADGILQRTQVQYSLAVSGIAGPGGGSQTKPVGTLWFAWASSFHPTCSQVHYLNGTRTQIRTAATIIAIEGLLDSIMLA